MIYKNRVGFADVDFARLPFYGRYYGWLEDAWEFYLHQFGIWYRDVVGRRGIGVPVTALECRYRRPMRLDDAFQVFVRVAELNRRGATVEFRFVDEQGEVTAEGSFVRRFVDMTQMKGTELPDDLFASFQALAEALSAWPEDLPVAADA